MMIGYARVSADDRNLSLQLDALRGADCEEIFQDVGSGADDNRKALAAALVPCAAGDVLVAWKIDRLDGTLLDLVELVENLRARGVGLRVLTGAQIPHLGLKVKHQLLQHFQCHCARDTNVPQRRLITNFQCRNGAAIPRRHRAAK
jgi:DNA invertase Pin-like site-specific DNA recombinase